MSTGTGKEDTNKSKQKKKKEERWIKTSQSCICIHIMRVPVINLFGRCNVGYIFFFITHRNVDYKIHHIQLIIYKFIKYFMKIIITIMVTAIPGFNYQK